MKLKIPCLHDGCKLHKGGQLINFEIEDRKCAYDSCERIAQTKKRIGFEFINICVVHASGEEKKE
jgi:hypothetical protein